LKKKYGVKSFSSFWRLNLISQINPKICSKILNLDEKYILVDYKEWLPKDLSDNYFLKNKIEILESTVKTVLAEN
jgi:hypothetical protein